MEYTKMSDRINSHPTEEFIEEEEIHDIKKDFAVRFATIVIAGLGLITALAWDRTLEDLFTEYFGPLNSISSKVIYASLITFFAVVISLILRRTFIRKAIKNYRRKKNK